MNVTFFDEDTGIMRGHWIGPAHLLEANTPPGCGVLEGHRELHTARVDVDQLRAERAAHEAEHADKEDAPPFAPSSAVVVDYQPPAPSPDHVWHEARKRWELSGPASRRLVLLQEIAALEARQPRSLREAVLGHDGALERLRDLDTQIEGLRAQINDTAPQPDPRMSAS